MESSKKAQKSSSRKYMLWLEDFLAFLEPIFEEFKSKYYILVGPGSLKLKIENSKFEGST